jgi:hypothetical protein
MFGSSSSVNKKWPAINTDDVGWAVISTSREMLIDRGRREIEKRQAERGKVPMRGRRKVCTEVVGGKGDIVTLGAGMRGSVCSAHIVDARIVYEVVDVGVAKGGLPEKCGGHREAGCVRVGLVVG